jgi:hypothetical protein
VVEALVAVREAMKALVIVAPVEERAVVEALVRVAVVAKSVPIVPTVVEALVITEEEARRLEVKVFRKRNALVPNDEVILSVGDRLPDKAVMVVVAKVEVPVMLRVPLEIREEVAVTDPKVEDPPVRDEIEAVIVLRSVAKKLVEVALVDTRLSDDRLVE